MGAPRTLMLTCLAMLAFSANSLLARQALSATTIDPALFTAIRITSGAAALFAYVWISGGGENAAKHGRWFGALALFVYAAAFSFAYVTVPAATGALILFAAVQVTMLSYGIAHGERLSTPQVAGLVLSVAGFVALLAPGVTAPPLTGAALMVAAGCAWGFYSLQGGTGDPARATAGNFLKAVPLALLLPVMFYDSLRFDAHGVAYAIASGALTSGAGYIIWYAALRGLSTTSAATVQLSVPAVTALLAVLLLGEPVGLRLILSSIAILGGIGVVIGFKRGAEV